MAASNAEADMRPAPDVGPKKKKEIKCVIWDLDNTVWAGTLLESASVTLRPGVRETLAALDGRGVLLSIASKNNHDDAMRKLKEFGIDHYFIYPEIGWNAKSESIASIQKNLNIGIDTFMFIDDDAFERAEVQRAHPAVTCLDSTQYANYEVLLTEPRLTPKYITEDSGRRRLMYLESMARDRLEEEYKGPKEEFLATLKMRFVISRAEESDLQRAEELTVRTNQLNSTGVTYSYEELDTLRKSPNHVVLICELTDAFGSYGKIGLAVVEKRDGIWWLRLMLMSCRVLSRGVGTIFLSYLLQSAKADKARFCADFIQTDKNRMMYISYKFSNFKEIETQADGRLVLENDLSAIVPFPRYVDVVVPDLA